MAASTSLSDKDTIGTPNRRLFSCALCYRQKRKCDKGSPCSHCLRQNVDCIPSPIETTRRPRKQRFPESELLNRIAKYEAALLSYGADLESIQSSGEIATSKGGSVPDSLPVNGATPEEVTTSFVAIIDGEDDNSRSDSNTGTSWYDTVFAHDGSSLLFAVDTQESLSHPLPFDIFKLWQIYCDHIHPISKLLHVPSFQRKLSTYGSLLHLAPAADQALFFALYSASISSLSADQCKNLFSIDKQVMLEEYKFAAQVWLRRAGVWRTSDLTVLQALILFLSSIQNTIDPRTLAGFTGVTDRIARRMGLHRDIKTHLSPLEREMRTRVWWEVLLLDAKAVERSGLGTSISTGHWNARLPLTRSDSDLDRLEGVSSIRLQSPPSSEMVCFLIRVEVSLFTVELHNERTGSHLDNVGNSNLIKRLDSIEAFQHRMHSQYLCYCDAGLASQRLAKMFAQASLSRLRISAYIVEDGSKPSIGIELLKHCVENLEAYSQMRSDVVLKPFKWFILQNMPVFAYINLLRLLQDYTSGNVVDRAWQVLQSFNGDGPRLVADNLTLKAWKARKKASSCAIDDPVFITEIRSRSGVDMSAVPTDDASLQDSIAAFSESNMMALMAEILSSEVYNDNEWPFDFKDP